MTMLKMLIKNLDRLKVAFTLYYILMIYILLYILIYITKQINC